MEHVQDDWKEFEQYCDDISGKSLPPELIRAGGVEVNNLWEIQQVVEKYQANPCVLVRPDNPSLSGVRLDERVLFGVVVEVVALLV